MIVNSHFKWKTLAIFLFSVTSLGVSLSAYADCEPMNGWDSKLFNIAFPRIAVPRNTPINTILFTKTVAYPDFVPFTTHCVGNFILYARFLNGWTPNSSGIAQTNVPGIGVRISYIGSFNGNSRLYGSGNNTYVITSNATNYSDQQNFSGNGFTIELIKTGPTSTGSLNTGYYASLNVKNLFNMAMINITDGGSISTPACNVTNTTISVPMGNVKKSEFDGVGSTPVSKNFDILLSCNPSPVIQMTINGTPDSSKAPGVIALSSSSGGTVADGVGIQLLSNNIPITLGEAIMIGTATTQNYSIPIVARYYQTKSTISAGIANGSVTFTMTYN